MREDNEKGRGNITRGRNCMRAGGKRKGGRMRRKDNGESREEDGSVREG